jgi:hypothetical protein
MRRSATTNARAPIAHTKKRSVLPRRSSLVMLRIRAPRRGSSPHERVAQGPEPDGTGAPYLRPSGAGGTAPRPNQSLTTADRALGRAQTPPPRRCRDLRLARLDDSRRCHHPRIRPWVWDADVGAATDVHAGGPMNATSRAGSSGAARVGRLAPARRARRRCAVGGSSLQVLVLSFFSRAFFVFVRNVCGVAKASLFQSVSAARRVVVCTRATRRSDDAQPRKMDELKTSWPVASLFEQCGHDDRVKSVACPQSGRCRVDHESLGCALDRPDRRARGSLSEVTTRDF